MATEPLVPGGDGASEIRCFCGYVADGWQEMYRHDCPEDHPGEVYR